jgi:hypothetical protein
MVVLGAVLLFRPAGVIMLNRDATEPSRPPTTGEVFRTRLLGLLLVTGGGYLIYLMLTGAPGAEFFPA